MSSDQHVLSLLLLALHQMIYGPDLPNCCYSYASRKLPKKLISRHYSTSSNCSLPAVVFVTKKGLAVCANPNDSWVQTYLRNPKRN
uniref:C-C motif chemokine 3-like n=1 Tax=Nothoprocta perdicaria TaxID=30464 RepID=A0A8C6YUT5_NOTPE